MTQIFLFISALPHACATIRYKSHFFLASASHLVLFPLFTLQQIKQKAVTSKTLDESTITQSAQEQADWSTLVQVVVCSLFSGGRGGGVLPYLG